MLQNLLFGTAIANILESVVDTCRESVVPRAGSIVYCDLAFGHAEHSGVYIGNNEIVHLNGNGRVEVVSPRSFMSNTTAANIYVSCEGRYVSSGKQIADNAKMMLGSYRDYNFILDNCHQFTTGCITGDFESSCSFMWMLKDEARKHMDANTWRHWDSDLY